MEFQKKNSLDYKTTQNIALSSSGAALPYQLFEWNLCEAKTWISLQWLYKALPSYIHWIYLLQCFKDSNQTINISIPQGNFSGKIHCLMDILNSSIERTLKRWKKLQFYETDSVCGCCFRCNHYNSHHLYPTWSICALFSISAIKLVSKLLWIPAICLFESKHQSA